MTASQSDLANPGANPGRAIAYMGKAHGEPELIALLVHLKQEKTALDLARTGDVYRADLYEPIIREIPEDLILALAAECHAADGSYPFGAISYRARRSSNARTRATLLDAAYSMVSSATGPASRGRAISFVSSTYDLAPSRTVAAALSDFVQGLITSPSPRSGTGRSESDILGPMALEVMQKVDPQLAAATAAAHPDWKAAMSIPGRT